MGGGGGGGCSFVKSRVCVHASLHREFPNSKGLRCTPCNTVHTELLYTAWGVSSEHQSDCY